MNWVSYELRWDDVLGVAMDSIWEMRKINDILVGAHGDWEERIWAERSLAVRKALGSLGFIIRVLKVDVNSTQQTHTAARRLNSTYDLQIMKNTKE